MRATAVGLDRVEIALNRDIVGGRDKGTAEIISSNDSDLTAGVRESSQVQTRNRMVPSRVVHCVNRLPPRLIQGPTSVRRTARCYSLTTTELVARSASDGQTGDVAAVTPTGQVGVFQTRLKRLEDLGLVRDVQRVQRDGAPSWTATFRPPLTLARVLSDPLLQYRIFVASMKRYRDDILARHRAAIGNEVEGRPATLSGLMAVSQHAGPALASWLANEADRRRFKQTTAAYGRTTGVF